MATLAEQRRMETIRSAVEVLERRYQDAGDGAALLEYRGYTVLVEKDYYKPGKHLGYMCQVLNEAGDLVKEFRHQFSRKVSLGTGAHFVLFAPEQKA